MSSENTVVSHKYSTNTMGGINKEELLHKESPISLTKTKLLHQNQKHFREKHLAFIFKVGGEGGGVHEKNVNVFKFPQK